MTPIVYLDNAQRNKPDQDSVALLIRSGESLATLTESLKRTAAGISPGIAIDVRGECGSRFWNGWDANG